MSQEITSLDNDGLKKLKQEWYNAALKDGTIKMLWKIVQELGKELNAKYGPKWRWKHEDIEIYGDGYGHYLTVHVNGKEVVSTHGCSQLFVRGDWLSRLQPFLTQAEAVELKKNQDKYLAERQALLKELGLID